MAIKKLKYKDIFTEGMDLPENNDMGSAAKPPKQDMGAGAGRGKQGGPTAKELSDYSRKKNEQKVDATIYMKEKGQPPMDPEDAYAKGGMAKFEKSAKDVEKKGVKEGSKADMAMDKKQMMGMNLGGMHPMPDGKMMKNSAMMKHGGSVSSSSRGNGIAVRGKTKGRLC